MTVDTALTIVSVASPVLVAVITGLFSVKQSKVQKEIKANQQQIEKKQIEAEKRGLMRRKEYILAIKMADANTQLTIGVATALKTGKANGEIEEGMKAVKEVREEYNNFLREVAAADMIE